MSERWVVLVALVAGVWAVGCGPSLETDGEGRYLVTNEGDEGEGSLRFVVEHAPEGAEIGFSSSVGEIVLGSPIDVEREELTLVGDGEVRLVAEGAGHLVVFPIARSVRLEGLVLEGGTGTSVSGDARFVFQDVEFRGTGSTEGRDPGGVFVSGSLRMEGVRFEGVANSNVAVTDVDHLILDDVYFENTMSETGDSERFFVSVRGAVREEIRLSSVEFQGGERAIGGIYYPGGPDLVVEDSTFYGLQLAAGSVGGALQVGDSPGIRIEVRGSHFERNGDAGRSGPNGAITAKLSGGATLIVEDSEFWYNRARGQGAAIDVETRDPGDRVEVRRSHFEGSITTGTLGAGGGAVFGNLRDGAEMVVEESGFVDNSTSEAGGGVHINTLGGAATGVTVEIRGSYFEENEAASTAGAVRASFNDTSTLVVERSYFEENVASDRGGALTVSGGDRVEVINSTFYRNHGVGAFYSTARETEVSFVTVVQNFGGGVVVPESVVGAYVPQIAMRGVLSVMNTPADLISPYLGELDQADIEHTLIADAGEDGEWAAALDELDGLVINAQASTGLNGPTAHGEALPIIGLASNHPGVGVIPEGECLDVQGRPVTEDQRGSPRPVGGACSVGAWERD